MTGMVTACMISVIMEGSDIRATPPWALISAGTLSRAMTADAPASSAIRACMACQKGLGISRRMDMPTCSTLTTSMITPPLSIRAKPALTEKLLLESPFVDETPLVWPFSTGRLEAMLVDVSELSVSSEEVDEYSRSVE